MKLTINDEKIEKPLKVYLEQSPEGVDVMIDGYYIIGLRNSGEIIRYLSVPDSFGFNRDSVGRVKIVSE